MAQLNTAAGVLGDNRQGSSIRMLCIEVLQVFKVLLLQKLVPLLVLLLSLGAYAPPLPAQHHGCVFGSELRVFGLELSVLALSEQEVRRDGWLGDLVFVLLGERKSSSKRVCMCEDFPRMVLFWQGSF